MKLSAEIRSSECRPNVQGLVAHATTFRTVAPYTFGIITAVLSITHKKMCISSHAPNRKRKATVIFRGHCRIMCLQYGNCVMSLSVAQNFHLACNFLEEMLFPPLQNHRTMPCNLKLIDNHILSTVRGPDVWDLAKVLENEWSTEGSCQDNFEISTRTDFSALNSAHCTDSQQIEIVKRLLIFL